MAYEEPAHCGRKDRSTDSRGCYRLITTPYRRPVRVRNGSARQRIAEPKYFDVLSVRRNITGAPVTNDSPAPARSTTWRSKDPVIGLVRHAKSYSRRGNAVS